MWNQCVEPEHSTQVLMQMIVLRVSHAIYIVAKPGSKVGHGRILYIVIGTWNEPDARNFVHKLKHNADEVLIPFYESSTVDELLERLPQGLSGKQVDIIATRWPFFKSVRDVALGWRMDEGRPPGFPKTELFKTSFQCLYNSLKGGLDANTQQYMSIMPKVNVKFEQKFVIRMILAVVTNSWRAFQLLRCTNSIEEVKLMSFKMKMKNMKLTLMDFNHKLAIGLLRVADDKKMSNMLYLESSILNTTTIGKKYGAIPEDLGFARRPDTLQDRFNDLEWPLRFRLKHFSKNETLVELRLTHSETFQHNIQKLAYNHGKNHCVFCYHRQTSYGCTLCKVLLCRHCRKGGPDEKSCFEIWHSSADLVQAKKKFDEINSGKVTKKKNGKMNSNNSAPPIIPFKQEVRKKAGKRKRTTTSPTASPALRTRSKNTTPSQAAARKKQGTQSTSPPRTRSRGRSKEVEQTPSEVGSSLDTPAQRTRSRG